MPQKRSNYFSKGFIDPLSLIAIGFLIVTVVAGTVVVSNKNISLNIANKAACLDACISDDDCGSGYKCAKQNNACPKCIKTTPSPTSKPTCDCVHGKLVGSSCGASAGMACSVNSTPTPTPKTKSKSQSPTPTPTPTPDELVGGGCGEGNLCNAPTATPTSTPSCLGVCYYGYSACTSLGRENGTGTCTGGLCCGDMLTNKCTKGNLYCMDSNTLAICKTDKSGYNQIACASGYTCDSAQSKCVLKPTPTPTPQPLCNCVYGKLVGSSCGASAGMACSVSSTPTPTPTITATPTPTLTPSPTPTETPIICLPEFTKCDSADICCTGLECNKFSNTCRVRNPDIVYYSQRDPKWEDAYFTCRDETIVPFSHQGCGETVTAMLLSTFVNKKYTPLVTKNSYFTHPDYCTGSGMDALVSILGQNGISTKTVSSENLLKSNLEHGKVAMVYIRFYNGSEWISHHTLAIDIDANRNIVYDDPWFGPETTLSGIQHEFVQAKVIEY